MTMNIKIISIAVAAVIALLTLGGWGLYKKGYNDSTRFWAAEAQKNASLVQKTVGDSNAALQKEKLAHFESLLSDRDKRVLELEAKLRASKSVESACDERDRALRAAVGLENVAARALGHLEAERKR
ncbi:MAG: hypothetical protein J6V64_06200 [Burkholderiaceae bacterium]|nr:hypothetical protein [Burkholderiaceae bacterium]